MSKMRTGWVVKNGEMYAVDAVTADTVPYIEDAYIWRDAPPDDIQLFAGERVVKVEWQPRIVKEVG